jgi:methylglutaconyl-CoA hydratase
MKMTDLRPETDLCILDIEGPVASLTLNREVAYNALNEKLITEIIELLQWTANRSVGINESTLDSNGNEYLRVLSLSANGKHFCAGADINMMREAGSRSVEENRLDSARLDNLFNSLWAHPCFTIGSIQGVALGGGAGLIACLDHVIVESNVKIALSEGKLGILPAVIGPYVYRKIGSAQFRRFSMLASRIDADEAQRIGFVNDIVDSPKSFISSIEVIVREVLSTGPMAVSEVKKLTSTFDYWNGSDEELRKWTLDKTSEMRGSIEGQEGLSSFIEHRKPTWMREDREN